MSCLCVWLLTVIDDITAQKVAASLSASPQPQPWTLHHLSIIWRTFLGQGLLGPQTLLRGFQLFMRVNTTTVLQPYRYLIVRLCVCVRECIFKCLFACVPVCVHV